MNVAEIMEQRNAFSFEVFPPKTDVGMEKLCGEGGVLEKLYTLNPDYISCTYGAGGTNVGKNLEVLKKIKADGKCTPVTHFTCVANTKEGIKDQLQTYLDNGIDHMLALRGDIPFGWTGTNGDLHYATELVKFVRKEFGDKLPIAVAGVDLDELMGGAQEMMSLCSKNDYNNPAWQYAAMRHELYRSGKKIELLACFEPSFRFMAEWWKQLYGESEGKDGKGIFPASVDLTPDLHSMGQYIQDGIRMLQETVVFFDNSRTSIAVPSDEENLDGLNYLAGREMSYINEKAMQATKAAHISGGVPVTEIRLPEIGAEALGALIYFFEFACGVSGYMEGVNPFNQPGVEAYKKNMFALLDKPGYEEASKAIKARL